MESPETPLFAQHEKTACITATNAWKSLQHKLELQDCQQEGVVCLLELLKNDKFLSLPFGRREAYLITAIRNRLYRLAARVYDLDDTDVESLADPNDPRLVIDLKDLIASASAVSEDAAYYLQFRVCAGVSWDDTRETLGWTNDRLAAARRTAGEYILEHLESNREIGSVEQG